MKSTFVSARLLVNGDRLNHSIARLAQIGKLSEGGVKRIADSEEDIATRTFKSAYLEDGSIPN